MLTNECCQDFENVGENSKNVKKWTLSSIILYIIGFYLIYTPDLTPLLHIKLFGIELMKYYVLFAGFVIVLIYFMFFRKKVKQKIQTKSLIVLYGGFICANLYFTIRAMFNLEVDIQSLRVVQNNCILLHIFYFIMLLDFLKMKGRTKEQLLKFILNLAIIQSFICITMLLVPELKQIAISLYYRGGVENTFISVSRLFGISEDYTFGTQIYHAMLCSICVVMAILRDKRYLLYVPFIFLAAILNGRTGMLIAAVCMVVSVIVLVMTGKLKVKMVGAIIAIMISVVVTYNVVKVFSVSTYNMLQSSIEDTLSLLGGEEVTGTYNILLNSMLYWPEGLAFIFGEGERVFQNSNYTQSDIGYVNDMHMGGLVYCSILYATILFFFLKCNKKQTQEWKYINFMCSMIMVITLMIANFKGEALRGGILITSAVVLKLILEQGDDEDEKSISNNVNVQNRGFHIERSNR